MTTTANKSKYLYRHIRPDTNQVFYVGIGREDTNRAWQISKRNSCWNKIVAKNDRKFIVEILLEELSWELANQKEIEFIKLYGRIDLKTGTLANLHEGGSYHVSGNKFSKETCRNMSKSHQGNLSNTGKICITNGIEFTFILKNTEVPLGWWKQGIRKGTQLSEQGKLNMSKGHLGNISNTGKISITNGIESTFIFADLEIPQGWYKGTIQRKKYSKELKPRITKGIELNLTPKQLEAKRLRGLNNKHGLGNKSNTGKIMINNGIKNSWLNKESIVPKGFIKGKLK